MSKLPRYPDFPLIGKKIFIRDRYAIDGETATQMITLGLMQDRERFVASLPDVYCVEGLIGLNQAFKVWQQEELEKKRVKLTKTN